MTRIGDVDAAALDGGRRVNTEPSSTGPPRRRQPRRQPGPHPARPADLRRRRGSTVSTPPMTMTSLLHHKGSPHRHEAGRATGRTHPADRPTHHPPSGVRALVHSRTVQSVLPAARPSRRRDVPRGDWSAAPPAWRD